MVQFTYEDFQKECAFFGLTTTLTEEEFDKCVKFFGYDMNEIYSTGCDVHAGFDFEMLISESDC